jgi:hypothetical protein
VRQHFLPSSPHASKLPHSGHRLGRSAGFVVLHAIQTIAGYARAVRIMAPTSEIVKAVARLIPSSLPPLAHHAHSHHRHSEHLTPLQSSSTFAPQTGHGSGGGTCSIFGHLHSAMGLAHCQHLPSAFRFALMARQRSCRSRLVSANWLSQCGRLIFRPHYREFIAAMCA